MLPASVFTGAARPTRGAGVLERLPVRIAEGLKNGGDGLRILILRSSSLGDICHTFPAVQRLREAMPGASLTWLVNEEYQPLVEGTAAVDSVLSFDRSSFREPRSWLRGLGRGRRVLKAIRGRRFHIVLDFQGLLRSALIAWSSKAPIRIGRAEGREGTFFYSQRHRSTRPMEHPSWRSLRLLESLGVPLSWPKSPLTIDAEVQARIDEKLAREGLDGPVVIAPGARWESKSWPKDSWQGLIDELKGQPLLLLGGPPEQALARELCKSSQARSWVGQTRLLDLAATLNRAALVIAGDSGPLHLAAALGRPVVGLYGSTVWRRTYPLGSRNVLIKRAGLECLECRARICPVAGHPCMTELDPKIVAAAVLGILKDA
jgi:heptosyltransferase I